MPRPTLKLPAKPVTDDARSPYRKPLRGGSKALKQSFAHSAAKTERHAVESRKPAPALPPVHGVLSVKVHPKRGVARSTGARALPPARIHSDYSAPRAEPVPQASAPPAPHRPLNEPPRLAKRVSEMAFCSRRQADEWIENGWIRVDGVVVTTLGARVHPNARIEIKEEASKHQSESVTILLNKPLAADRGPGEGGSEALMQLIRPENRWVEDLSRCTFKATHLRGLAQAGKLDAESTGMLVFTQEGSVARRITGDDTRLEKEYMVRVEGELSPEGMKLLNHGLELDEVKLKRAQVSWQNEQQLRFVVHESRQGQIQRMCELVGLRVTSIKRIRIGSVALGKLPSGQWRYLREDERF
ncbi:S4 domain-containing protein [Propionivibrio sp.]|uniref:pseudouridine synthase n=1 Tax=Propionivibrio sp. TaxID=2212460 RepID=UPI00262D0735|nr:S4 domain-containing protein [Propionivibrio sp.]